MSKFDYNNLLFRELRMVALGEDMGQILCDEDRYVILDEKLTKIMTLNENLKALGYCFTPDSYTTLSHSEIEGLYDQLKDYIGHVDAEPMYPGFPEEVMQMDEATFRFHQMLHYMSTYGVEFFTGCEVNKGWLPESNAKKRTKSDIFKTDLKQIEVIADSDKYIYPAKVILSRKLRLTEAGKQLATEAVKHLSAEQLESLEIPFKENVQVLFDSGIEDKNLSLLKTACKNTMDAFKCIEVLLDDSYWHLRTSQKRIVAKLLDSFENYSFEENLIYSNSRREKIIRILDHIDYSTYSRNKAHIESVNLLKNKALHSWMSGAEQLIQLGRKKEAVEYLSKRPGMFLRMCVRLLGLDYNPSMIEKSLCNSADKLSAQTIIDLLNFDYISKYEDQIEKTNDWGKFHDILKMVLKEKLKSIDTELKNKDVFLDGQDYDINHSMILKSEEGGYNRSGLAFKIPENLSKVRFFVYWNDDSRVDIDLHAGWVDESHQAHNVGWDGSRNESGIVFSGDITHSDAAEYIDIDLSPNSKAVYVATEIDLYSGKSDFSEIETCFTGLMGVENLGQDVQLYDPKACFVSQELTSKTSGINYGIVHLKERYIRYIGQEHDYRGTASLNDSTMFSLKDYLDVLSKAQNINFVDNKEKADLSVSIAKGGDVSLVDKNFFLDL